MIIGDQRYNATVRLAVVFDEGVSPPSTTMKETYFAALPFILCWLYIDFLVSASSSREGYPFSGLNRRWRWVSVETTNQGWRFASHRTLSADDYFPAGTNVASPQRLVN